MRTRYLARTLEAFFKKADRQFPALLLTGARQAGKTTFAQLVKAEDRA